MYSWISKASRPRRMAGGGVIALIVFWSTLVHPPGSTAGEPGGLTVIPANDGFQVPEVGDFRTNPLDVRDVAGLVSDVNVALHDFESDAPADFDLVLEAPDGRRVILMSDACGNAKHDHLELRFDDSAGDGVPTSAVSCESRSYVPTNAPDVFEPSDDFWLADSAQPSGSLNSLDGIDPNGRWKLLASDDKDNFKQTTVEDWTLELTVGPSEAGIPEPTSPGGGAPRPVEVTIAGVDGVIADVNVTVGGLVIQRSGDLELVLQAPSGRAVHLMSDACGSTPFLDAVVTFDDDAAPMPAVEDAACSGPMMRFRPTNNRGASSTQDANGIDLLPPGVPTGSAGGLSTFVGEPANGIWRVFAWSDRPRTATDGPSSGSLMRLPQLSIVTAQVADPGGPGQPSGPALDRAAPNTRFKVKPRTSLKRQTVVRFASTEPSSSFFCKVDRAKPRQCTSPLRLRALRPGRHRVSVRAVDAAGNRDRTPAIAAWRVLKKR
jgi:hypothetical protein